MNKIALITGASAGIGEACALKLAENGFDLIIAGRREKNIKNLSKKIQDTYGKEVFNLCLDVRNYKEVEKTINDLPEKWKNIDVLVNNAGLAVGVSPIEEGVIDDWDRMIDTNVKGLLYVTRCVSPLMASRKKGLIVNISSIAGKEAYPGGNVYCGTKHAVEAITKGMRIDLLPHNIRVSSIAPGMVETEFSLVRFKGDQSKAEQVYNGFEPLKAEDIAESLLFIATRPEHVSINDILIMPSAQASARDVNRKL
ncbi:SDR family NAD(P)-dependent oxidoreductase [Ancylomarina euxinus]|uniref:SDR family NAD(P)-dependent oxidoreductase n=1 Tax=Ancylomarina euxinus TaxID=2283627 RepID=A0A425Y6K2_9BACT|nr:SDR family NAD(P)-dependent oxidoreductase [Ancylomarina euxinus]MCZ4693991.1 SDR family NAD(P)-dependent oxidoreductase [Ancylomarina euxinus]MUP14588.1 SDR family NAD(P)-dependent oxidoreductase [Ancylomarina euxinus]RRG24137.1 SDR family NAD(P)-dependent oxidoreductase [Ancylomarina euxinus]